VVLVDFDSHGIAHDEPFAGIAAMPANPLSASCVYNIGNLYSEKGMLDCRAFDKPVVRGRPKQPKELRAYRGLPTLTLTLPEKRPSVTSSGPMAKIVPVCR
jgi:hypothetical protein